MLHRRIPLAHLPTPLVPADRLGAALGLGAGTLWVKHDDLTGLALGGNKVRKLEYLCADALAAGADTLVTGGGRQSNHCRLTVAAANRVGLACTLVLGGGRPEVASGNVLLDELLGADIEWTGDADYDELEAAILAKAERLRGQGRAAYPIPVGGASPVGTLGYVAAGLELGGQLPGLGTVVVADGSGGTHAGLAAGLGHLDRVLGVDVGTRPDLEAAVPAMARAAADLAGVAPPVGALRLDTARIGDGYGCPSRDAREALDLAARHEGLVLDPVYSGKALAGLIAGIRDATIDPSRPVVLLHTGGAPALFSESYADWIRTGEGTDDAWRHGGAGAPG